MSRLQTVENALAEMNGALFQELCDSFLILRNENYSAFSRSGSQLGKQKTIKGTPDTFLLLPNGKYIFVEYSTNKTQGVSKLKKDIIKCLNEDKTGIPLIQITEIILCVNFKLKTNEIESLRTLLIDTRINLNIYTLDSLALELKLQHRDLIHQYLNLPFDSGQIVSIEKFIEEYNKTSNGIATPLDNTFLHRAEESKQLKESIKNNDFVILTGAPGVGKTKLALEVINEFIIEDNSYSAYCISYKHHTLLEDLYQQFDDNKKYILFVDDANRIDAFQQIIGFYKSRKKGNFKIILTVRDYAFQEIGRLCHELNPVRIDIDKFNDEQIKSILESKPFEILNSKYQKEILRISEGNPRIAIMSALLAKDKQNISVLSDVSDLFERYFSTFINDDGQFSNDLNLKCLGIISFFYTIPYKDKEITKEVLDNFNINYNDFIQVIDKLDRLELVEIQYDNVKIPEQNLSTYFFYRSFIKDDLLSFKTLLEKYFYKNIFRFRDTVVPANNTFGPNRVMDKLKPYLQSFWEKIKVKETEDNSYKFLNTFWFYLQDETLEYVYTLIKDIPTPEIKKLKVTYTNNEFSGHNQNKIIELLGNFFHHTSNLKEALNLSFLYTRKKTEHLSELIHKIVGLLAFDQDDYQIRYYKQTTLFDIIINGIKTEKEFYGPIFFELSKTFLKYKFHHFKGARKNSFYHYDYPIQNSLEVRAFRKKIWNTIEDNFDDFSTLAFDVLDNQKDTPREINKDLMEYDLNYTIPIIENKLNKESLLHAKYVHNKIMWLKKSDISDIRFDELKDKFTNKLYKTYLKIDWDRFRDKDIYDFDDFREYDKLKEQEIRESFRLKSFEKVKSFYKTYEEIRKCSQNDWNYPKVLDIVIDENLTNDFDIGFQFLELIINTKNHLNYIPNLAFRNKLIDNSKIDKIWSIIDKKNYNNYSLWKLAFFDNLDDKAITKKHFEMFIQALKETKNAYISYFEKVSRFKKVEPKFFEIILSIIIESNNNGGEIKIWMNFFEEHYDELGNDIELIKIAYLQQDSLQNHFDYQGKGFLKILKTDPNFLLEYVQIIQSNSRLSLSRENKKLGFVWEVDEIELPIKEVFNLCAKDEPYFGILNHYCNAFFDGISEEFKRKAELFLIQYAKENNSDYQRMNIVVDIVRGSMKQLFDKILLQQISLNQDIEIFSRIWWRGNGGTYSGDVIIGDIEATDWRNILSIVEKNKTGLEYILIKNHIKKNIEYALKSGDRERQRRFLTRDR